MSLANQTETHKQGACRHQISPLVLPLAELCDSLSPSPRADLEGPPERVLIRPASVGVSRKSISARDLLLPY